jgi:cholesterol transport system auxiliary component
MRAVLAFLACVPLGACTGSLFTSKLATPVEYMLSAHVDTASGQAAAPSAAPAPAAAQLAAPIPVDLSILKPRMRPGLETDRIVAKYPDRRLDYYAGAKWNGPLDDVLQDLTVQLFHQRARLRSISSESTRFTSGYWLEIEVEDFQAEYVSPGSPPVIKVHLLARLGRAADHAGVGSYEATASQPATENRLEPIIDAYERAANTALSQIIDSTAETLAAAAAH